MQIIINNKLAALKEGTSFDFVSENRLFSGSDGYTLNISFPLRNCPENIAIFGHLYRTDVTPAKLTFDCEIRADGFHRFGSIVVTGIDEAEVKTQFLEGRSEQNFANTLSKTYINEMNLGHYTMSSPSLISPSKAWGTSGNAEAVALPWVNEGSGVIDNRAEYKDGAFKWHADTKLLSWQPYLLTVVKAVCHAIGYHADFSAWEEREELRYLLVCNTLPGAWDMFDYALALPHWTVEEFFAKLELFLNCEFDFDHRTKTVSFGFTADRLEAIVPVVLDSVVEEHSTEVASEDAKCEYTEAKNLVYKDCDHDTWKYYSCDWFIRNPVNLKKFGSLADVIMAYREFYTYHDNSRRPADADEPSMDDVLYAELEDAYFIIEVVGAAGMRDDNGHYWVYRCRLRPINLLGGRIVDVADDAPKQEIEFVPVRIDSTDDAVGRLMFLNPQGDTEQQTESDPDTAYKRISLPCRLLKAGEKDKTAEFYDRIYIAWWDGVLWDTGKLPRPYVENIEVSDDWSDYREYHFSLRLNDRNLNSRRSVLRIDPSRKTAFKFISDSVPNVRALFIINGKRYVCEKITATFTENGMSQLLKGSFYPVAD